MIVDYRSKTPWIIDTSDGGYMRILASDDRATIVASVLGHPENNEAKADALLMVNAPVMFDAITEALALIKALDKKTLNVRMKAIEKILHKAIENIT